MLWQDGNKPSISNVVLCRYKKCDCHMKILQDILKASQVLSLLRIISVAVAFPSPVSVSVELWHSPAVSAPFPSNNHCGGKLLYGPVHVNSAVAYAAIAVASVTVNKENETKFCELFCLNMPTKADRSISLSRPKKVQRSKPCTNSVH